MTGFTKLFGTIITSSVWSEDDKTRIMWITMLASANAKGHVSGSIPGMATIARMNVEDAERSIKSLCSPDPYSRSKEHEGRRLLECDGGWLIANYQKYRQKRDPEKRREQNREAKRRQRSQQNVSKSANVSNASAAVSNRQQPSAMPKNRKTQTKTEVVERKELTEQMSQQNISQCQPMSAQAEAEADKETHRKSENSRLASFLFQEIRKRKPDFRKPNLQSWAVHIEKMIRIDHRKPERIEAVIRWCQADRGTGNGQWRGWQNNILSTQKLRAKFDKLELSMEKISSGGDTPMPIKRDADGLTARDRLLNEMDVLHGK